jgi:hypothetical protein
MAENSLRRTTQRAGRLNFHSRGASGRELRGVPVSGRNLEELTLALTCG